MYKNLDNHFNFFCKNYKMQDNIIIILQLKNTDVKLDSTVVYLGQDTVIMGTNSQKNLIATA